MENGMGKKHKKRSAENNGEFKGLLVGINYRGTRNQLGGCINDALAVRKQLMATYPNANLELMTDDTPVKPTRDNILNKLKDLVANARSGDTIMFHYSGHGSQVPDLDGDEDDGMDETICPINFLDPRTISRNGRILRVDSQIVDDEINEIISDVPHGVKFLMLSDSCHSGSIADLKNDFDHYQGPSTWEYDTTLPTATPANATSSFSSYTPTQLPQAVEQIPQSIEAAIIYCKAAWTYVRGVQEVWLTPVDDVLYEEFGHKKCVVKMSNTAIPHCLLANPNKPQYFNTTFKKLTNGNYQVSSTQLGISNIIITSSVRSAISLSQLYEAIATGNLYSPPDQRELTPNFYQLPNRRDLSEPGLVTSHYDEVSGKHHHVHKLTGKKRTLNMRAPNSCNGGELRVISGCRDNETSADTGTNGACTLAFLETVKYMGGLPNFFSKIFSHNVEDLKLIQDNINHCLSNFGFTQQHPTVSWDHSHSNRSVTDPINSYNYNAMPLYRSLPSYSQRVLYNYPVANQRQAFDSYPATNTDELTYVPSNQEPLYVKYLRRY